MTPDADSRIVEVDEMLVRPGTYFNPQTEVVVTVDDSASLDQEIFNLEAYEGADWVRISDEVPIDEGRLDEALEEFQARHHGGPAASMSAAALDPDEDAGADSGEDAEPEE